MSGSRLLLKGLGIGLILSTLLSGCLMVRIYEFKGQFCDYRRNFQLVVDDGVSLVMHRPVLLDRDVICLLGADPTLRKSLAGLQELVYVVEKDLPVTDPGYAIPVRLRFREQDGDYRLSEGVIDKNLSSMITPGLIEETVAHACVSKPSILQRNVKVDLSGLDRDAIPRGGAILEALGEPHEVLEDGRGMVYRFRLKDAGPETEKSYARVWFDATGEVVERVRFRYLRYELDADFVAGEGVIKVFL